METILILLFIISIIFILFFINNIDQKITNKASKNLKNQKNYKICVLQADNRTNIDYVNLSIKVNKKICLENGYDYFFNNMNNKTYVNVKNFKTKKIYIVDEFINNNNNNYDIVIFLDTDAWIQNPKYLNEVIDKLMSDKNKHGCFSRDPYLLYNTYINSGSFMLKINDYTINMYKYIINHLQNYKKYYSLFPYDQFYISDYVHKNNNDFYIFKPHIMNTPDGLILRHNWNKCRKMYYDMNNILKNKIENKENPSFIFKNDLDDKGYKPYYK